MKDLIEKLVSDGFEIRFGGQAHSGGVVSVVCVLTAADGSETRGAEDDAGRALIIAAGKARNVGISVALMLY